MKILISGSHGLVGRALMTSLIQDGHEVVRLVRRQHQIGSPEIEWDPKQGVVDTAHLEGFEVVVHLAGESIAEGRWTEDKKRRIRESRVRGTQILSQALPNLSHRPKTFLSASAIGYYGNRGNEILDETSPAGSDFLARVCVEWEQATSPAVQAGIRTVNMRFGVILSGRGGALAKMLPPFRMGVGGRIGSGEQWMSWILLDDVVRAIKSLVNEESLAGPVNVVAPNPVTNTEFTRQLARTLSRPAIFPVPAFAARLAFGEMADALLLSSQRVKPSRLIQIGHEFLAPELPMALKRALAD